MSKTYLRQKYKDKRKTFIESLSRDEYNSILKHIQVKLLSISLPLKVGAFWPKADEFNICPILYELRERGHEIALPFARKDYSMTFHLWDPEINLITDDFGILSPDPKTPSCIPEVFLVPLLAFDQNCYRLGYGIGHYDRYFAHLKNKFTSIGIALQIQKCATLPIQEHDIQLDYIITEKAVYRKNI